VTTLVLGGASDIGSAIAAKLPGDVILAGPNPSTLAQTAKKLGGGRTVTTETLDIADGDHREFFQRLQTRKPISTVIVAAGMLGNHEDMLRHPEHADALARVNYTGAANALLHAAQMLERNGGGTLIVLSSAAGQRIRRENFIYGASKAALDAFTAGLRQQHPRIRVLIVRPGFVHSKMTAGLPTPPLARTPEHVAKKTVKALRGNKTILWVPGAMRWVTAIGRHLPDTWWEKLTSRRT